MAILKKIIAFIAVIIITLGMSAGVAKAASPFTDVSKNMEGYEHIIALQQSGIIQGYDNGTYQPYKRLTRAQGAIIIGRALEINTTKPHAHTFQDINEKVNGHEYINALTNIGVFDQADKFNPYNPLTRAQMAKILVNAFNLDGTSTKNFRDIPKSHWAYDYIQTLVAIKVTAGTSKTTFSPGKTVTRVQMATFINRTLTYLDRNETDRNKETSEIIADDIFDLTNEARERHSLKPFKKHPKTREVAMIKAKDLYVNDYFSHTSPVYGSPFDMMKQHGIQYRYAGENIGYGYPTAEAVVEGWMNSPGHRKNILNAQFTHLGIGYYNPENSNHSDK